MIIFAQRSGRTAFRQRERALRVEGAIKSEERRESKEREGRKEKGMFRLMFCENCLTTDIFK